MTTLKQWVQDNGGVPAVAKRFKLHRRTVNFWLSGHTSPTAGMMVRLVRASKGKLTCDQIVFETQGIRRG